MPRRARSGRLTGQSCGRPGPPSAARPPQDPPRSAPVHLWFIISADRRAGDRSLARSVRRMCGRFRGDVVVRVFFIRGGLRRGCLVLGIQVSATGFGFLKSVQVVRDQERDRAVLAGSALLRSQTLLVADVSSPSVSNAASIVVSQPCTTPLNLRYASVLMSYWTSPHHDAITPASWYRSSTPSGTSASAKEPSSSRRVSITRPGPVVGSSTMCLT